MTSHLWLTLLVPLHAEERVIDFLLSHDDAGIEFSMHSVAARGPLVRMDRGDERVLGFASRVEVKLILSQPVFNELIAPLNALLSGVDGGYWVTPIARFGPFDARMSAQAVAA